MLDFSEIVEMFAWGFAAGALGWSVSITYAVAKKALDLGASSTAGSSD